MRRARSLGRFSSRRVNFVAQRVFLLFGRRSSADEKYDEYDGEEQKKEDNVDDDEVEEPQEGTDSDENCIWEREYLRECCGIFSVFVGWDG